MVASSSFQTFVIGANQPVGQFLSRSLSQQGLMYKSIALESRDKLPAMSAGRPFFVLTPSLLDVVDLEHAEFWLERAQEMDACVILLSSMAVYRYRAGMALAEDDEEFADSELAQQVVALEAKARQNERHVILRAGQSVSLQGEDFASQILARAREQQPLDMDMQRLFCPTPADDTADVILAMMRQLVCSDELFGTYHFSGVEAVSSFAFAEVLLAQAGQYEDFSEVKLGSQEGGMMPAVWTSESDNTRLFHTFGIQAKAWRQGVSRLLQKYYRIEEQ